MDLGLWKRFKATMKRALTKKSTNCREPIPPEARLTVTMRYLALGDGFLSLSQQFRMGLSTVREIVRETCKAIVCVLGETYLSTPSSKEAWLKIASDYKKTWNCPHVLGTLDGKHVRIVKPRKSGSFFYNYKDYFSVVLLAIASADYKFIYIDVGAEGKASDGGVWAKSSFHQHLFSDENSLNVPNPDHIPGIHHRIPYFLIGDDAFPLGCNLMKPYPGHNLTRKQRIYNYRISRCRRIVENTFGILTCRFRIFRRTIEVSPDFVTDIVMAACVVHNYLRTHAANEYVPAGFVDSENEEGNCVPGAWRREINLLPLHRSSQRNASEYAKHMRNTLADYFVSREGEVPWQYKYI